MSLHRVTLVALATLFTGITSAAFAGCCQWGAAAPVVYATSYVNGCGGCGTAFAPVAYVQPAPVVYSGGCGGCAAPLAYAEPVMAAPVATWGTGCGCGHSAVYESPAYMEPEIAPAPIYVTNQGPDYTGPGVMNPYRTWSPAAAAVDYPYVSRHYGYGRPYYHGARYAYREHYHGHAHWWRRPLGVRD